MCQATNDRQKHGGDRENAEPNTTIPIRHEWIEVRSAFIDIEIRPNDGGEQRKNDADGASRVPGAEGNWNKIENGKGQLGAGEAVESANGGDGKKANNENNERMRRLCCGLVVAGGH